MAGWGVANRLVAGNKVTQMKGVGHDFLPEKRLGGEFEAAQQLGIEGDNHRTQRHKDRSHCW